jgi:nucleotide-binding universal stress UspA family protein
MFKRLLVPLDGSHLAEAALPAAAFLAQKLNATVTLVHIVEHHAPAEVHGERHLTNADEAIAYLTEVARSAFPAGVQTEQHVHTVEVEDISRGIVDHITELHPDLIVMCTHGHGGLRDLIFGNIPQQVVGRGTIPVLLIQPGPTEIALACGRILVPLDGTAAHEQGLPVAQELARACGGEVYLVWVVPTLETLSPGQAATGRLLPGATRAMLEMACQDAETYLTDIMRHMRSEGLTVRAKIARGDPPVVINQTALDANADLIVLGTHGKSGMEAFWSGSTAAKVSARSKLPLLLVPIPESGPNGS